MLGLILINKKYIFSSITPEYDNSMKQLNEAKSNPGAGNSVSNEFGINSPYNTNNYSECGQKNCP